MSSLNFLRYAVNKVTEEQAAKILAAAGIRFRIGGNQWVAIDDDGKLSNEQGQPVTAGVGAVTGIEIDGERRTANSMVRGMEMQPTEGAQGSASFMAQDEIEGGRQLINVGTGETVRKVEISPGVYQTVAAAPNESAARHSEALQRPPQPGAEVMPNPENQQHTGPASENAEPSAPGQPAEGQAESETPADTRDPLDVVRQNPEGDDQR